MKKRKPQKVCKCGHARTRHYLAIHSRLAMSCAFCDVIKCPGFEQDNLKTLEKLSAFYEQKKIAFGVSL